MATVSEVRLQLVFTVEVVAHNLTEVATRVAGLFAWSLLAGVSV